MTTVYDIIREIKSFLRENPIVNTVTFGDITQIDLNKTTIFPLSHFILGNIAVTDHTLRITISMLFIDIVDYSKEHNPNDFGDREDASNLVDVYNTQLAIAAQLISNLRKGDLFRQGYQLVGEPVLVPFKDRFESDLAGWSTDVVFEVKNDSLTTNDPTC